MPKFMSLIFTWTQLYDIQSPTFALVPLASDNMNILLQLLLISEFIFRSLSSQIDFPLAVCYETLFYELLTPHLVERFEVQSCTCRL